MENKIKRYLNRKNLILGGILLIILLFAIVFERQPNTSYNYNNPVPTVYQSITPTSSIHISTSQFLSNVNLNKNSISNLLLNQGNIKVMGSSNTMVVYKTEGITGDYISNRLGLNPYTEYDGSTSWKNDQYLLSYYSNSFHLKNLKQLYSGSIKISNDNAQNIAKSELNKVFGLNKGDYSLVVSTKGNQYLINVNLLSDNIPIFPQNTNSFIAIYLNGNGELDNIAALDFPVGFTSNGILPTVSLQQAVTNAFYSTGLLSVISDTSNTRFTSGIPISLTSLSINNITLGYTYLKGNDNIVPVYIGKMSATADTFQGTYNLTVIIPAIRVDGISILQDTTTPIPSQETPLDYGSKH